ncbi:MAG: hypothetical protein GEV09_18270 [Pseudonocardiaceae bacterium]|nr:hypothetical protein [Pseudonocardiaceae bacterium]
MSLDDKLLARLGQAMVADPELGVVGKFFTCSFLLGCDGNRYLLRVRNGSLDELLVDPHPTEPWQFAIKAPSSTWQRYLQASPPAEFHDIWAAAWLGHMTLEGDMKVFMQHHMALWRTLKLLRATASSAPAA